MRILPISDLHLEIWKDFHPKFDLKISRPDVVILAGDIYTGEKAVAWASKVFDGIPVLYVHGNHEAYGKNLEDMQNDIVEACRHSNNVHFLNCDEFIVGNVRFLGATMWTDFRLFGDDERQFSMREADAVMNDYKRIRLSSAGYRKLRPSDTAKFHSIQKKWLSDKLANPFLGKTVVVTHMAPSMKSVSEQYSDDLVSGAYASNLEEIAKQADLWIHGHMHESFDYYIDECRVVCNPCGYRTRSGTPENINFNPNLVIEFL
ncbi:metallophosphoesterase [Undibacterium sp. SXout11W]|uniref:metallophosphoesterase n=1 Tax=Undibacterium sp. SXout11W TaxID=3413050 RepID=UPI003BF33313